MRALTRARSTIASPSRRRERSASDWRFESMKAKRFRVS